MTKEEIEKLAELQFPSAITKECCKFGFIKGYQKCQENMGKISEWQLCPKCFGEGLVSNIGTSSSTYKTCPVCDGNKTLIKPII